MLIIFTKKPWSENHTEKKYLTFSLALRQDLKQELLKFIFLSILKL